MLLGFCAFLGYSIAPNFLVSEQVHSIGVVLGGFVFLAVLVVERVIKRVSPYALLGGCMGVIAAILITLILRSALGLEEVPVSVMMGILIICSHLGFVVGARAVRVMRLASAKTGMASSVSPKILDTSAIIDGRIVDMVELGFVGGPLVAPQYVLNELQAIADSSDPLRRARGRRGLGILEKIQSTEGIEVRIVDDEFPRIKEVDSKIVAMAKAKGYMIVTTDFNLSKVAELQGIRVLNVHQLSQAVRPGGAARREGARDDPEDRQGAGPGRGLPGRRHHGGGRGRLRADGRIGRGRRHLGAPDQRRPYDLHETTRRCRGL